MLMKKMLRDARHNFRQFAAIFLLSALAMYMFTLFRSSDLGAYEALEKFEEASRFPSIWVYGESFEENDEEAVLSMPEVTAVQRRTKPPDGRSLNICRTGTTSGFQRSTICAIWVAPNSGPSWALSAFSSA